MITARRRLGALYRKEWVVYAKKPFGGPKQVLKYLARYTHRVAIGNGRLLDVSEAGVTFRYKDYADRNEPKRMTLSGVEFLRRFSQHVLPERFVKIRHYGLLANRQRAVKLNVCRYLLQEAGERSAFAEHCFDAPVKAVREPCCERCGSPRIVQRTLLPLRLRCVALAPDSS